MAIEADAALEPSATTAANAHVWNPDGLIIEPGRLLRHPLPELPRELADAVDRLIASAG
jgi:hypothetical protein